MRAIYFFSLAFFLSGIVYPQESIVEAALEQSLERDTVIVEEGNTAKGYHFSYVL